MIITVPLEFYYKILMEYCNTQNIAYMDNTELYVIINDIIDIPDHIVTIIKNNQNIDLENDIISDEILVPINKVKLEYNVNTNKKLEPYISKVIMNIAYNVNSYPSFMHNISTSSEFSFINKKGITVGNLLEIIIKSKIFKSNYFEDIVCDIKKIIGEESLYINMFISFREHI